MNQLLMKVGFVHLFGETLFPLLESLQQKGTPIDGVGFQLHIDTRFDDFDEVEANFQRVADMGLELYVTELDVSIFDGNTNFDDQARVYERILDICLNQPACKGLQLWGFTDQYSWRRPHRPLILNAQTKPSPVQTTPRTTPATIRRYSTPKIAIAPRRSCHRL